MNTLPVVWVMMGLRFLGASPDEEGKWLPYTLPYQTKEACFAAKAEALIASASIALTLIAFPLRPSSNPRAIPTNTARNTRSGARPSATGSRTSRSDAVPNGTANDCEGCGGCERLY